MLYFPTLGQKGSPKMFNFAHNGPGAHRIIHNSMFMTLPCVRARPLKFQQRFAMST